MKTAEEILNEYMNDDRTKGSIVEAMKAYGKQCAQQALKDASEKVFGFSFGVANKELIINTPIHLP